MTQEVLPVNIAFFTGYLPPHAVPVLREISHRVRQLTILLSTPMESNRHWDIDWAGLDVRVQKTWTRKTKWKHMAGFKTDKETHFPLDTLRQIRNLEPDVIVSEELGFRSLLCGWSSYRSNTPLLLVCNLSEHTESGRGWLRNRLRRWLARRATATAVNSQSGRRYLAGIGFPEESLFDFPYAAVPGIFDQLPLERQDTDAKRILVLGEMYELKGVLPFLECLEAFAKQSQQHVSVTFAGGGPLEAELRRRAQASQLELDVIGFQDYDGVSRLMRQHGILAFPTLGEEWGMVVNEALAAGLPILGSRYSQAVEELVVDHQNGWKFFPDSPEDMLRAVGEALNTPTSELSQMRLRCRSSIEERSPERAAELFTRAIREVIGNPCQK